MCFIVALKPTTELFTPKYDYCANFWQDQFNAAYSGAGLQGKWGGLIDLQ